MRPAHKSLSAGVWMVREQAGYEIRSRSFESIRTWPFDRYRLAEVNPIRSFSLSQTGKRQIYMSMRLDVGNLALQTNSQKLENLFAAEAIVAMLVIARVMAPGATHAGGARQKHGRLRGELTFEADFASNDTFTKRV
jgi:hypothetical protein